MKKIITYGTFDLLHEGHINILRRAKALGDYLIVGVTSDTYDRYRGKLNVRQPLTDRITAVRDTGFADQIVIEDYEGQKIEDIKKYGVDVITLGSDWTGRMDYLKKYCDVIYLPRTENISSTLLRTGGKIFRLGLMCDYPFNEENLDEIKFVSGIDVNCLYSPSNAASDICIKRSIPNFSSDKDAFSHHCDIVFVDSCAPSCGQDIRSFLEAGLHVISPHSCCLTADELESLDTLAQKKSVSLLLGPSFSSLISYTKLINITLSGAIGTLRGVELSITQPCAPTEIGPLLRLLAPICCLPVVQLMGWDIKRNSCQLYGASSADSLVICDLETTNAFAHLKISRNIRTECRCIIQGDDAYIKVPSPWWDMDYFEIRYRSGKIKKFSWPTNGKPLRYQLADFVRLLSEGKSAAPQMKSFLRLMRVVESIFVN